MSYKHHTLKEKEREFIRLGFNYYPNLKLAWATIDNQNIILSANPKEKGYTLTSNWDIEDIINFHFTNEVKMLEAAKTIKYFRTMGTCPFDGSTLRGTNCPSQKGHNHITKWGF